MLLSIISFATSEFIAKSFNQSQLAPVLKSLSFVFIIAAFNQIQIALLKRNFAFKSLANRALLGILIAGIVGIYMALSGYGVW